MSVSMRIMNSNGGAMELACADMRGIEITSGSAETGR